MYFNCKRIAVVVGLFAFIKSGDAQEQLGKESMPINDIEMIVQPNKCVALTQGRRCYAQVNITWQSEIPTTVCLIESNTSLKLNCWEQKRQGQFTYEMASAEDVTLSLMPLDSSPAEEPLVITSATIEVSWLYEGSARKRRWRLF